MMTSEHFWLTVGFLGQAFFSMRFLSICAPADWRSITEGW